MENYVLERSFSAAAELSENVLSVANMFGIGARRDQQVKVLDRMEVVIGSGQVVYITGGSGAGKSVLLSLLREQMSEVLVLDEQQWPAGKAVVDCFEGPLDKVLYWLSMAGLSDAFAILRRPEELSDGQRYRFRLALALSRKPKVVCVDEFCNRLDRITAAVVAHNVRKYADRFGTTFVVATSHDDLLEDLEPDVVVVKYLGSDCDVYYPKQRKGA